MPCQLCSSFHDQAREPCDAFHLVSFGGEFIHLHPGIGRLSVQLLHKMHITYRMQCLNVLVNDIVPIDVVIAEIEHFLRAAADGFEEFRLGGLKHCVESLAAGLAPLADVRAKHPERLIMKAVKGMLPKNRLAAKLLTKLKVYKGSEHPHTAQNPEPLTLN